ncbi:MAG TPA: hypothetical protein VMV50_01385 [Candidatus Paceibacterota bacterium]|nr:hypothetical protein [Candidatus Paceibacterota bacterium]
MRITQALGSGLFLVIVAHLMPSVFAQLARTAVVFLQSSQAALAAAGMLAAHAGTLTPPLN